jgi:transcriptional regulator with XRE-family HTH domain
MSAEHFAGRLREMREAAGLSQEQLAERSGLRPSAIRDLEQGRNSPRWGTVLRLADALGVADLREFAREPGPLPPPRRGRPRKVPGEARAATSKRRRGPKPPGAEPGSAGSPAAEEQAVAPSGGQGAGELPLGQRKPKQTRTRRPRG